MKLELNGKEYNADNGITVQNLIDELKLNIKSTAVAVNKTIISKSSYAAFVLNDNDKIDLVSIAPGG
ncbi:MAG: sulfur carrier protein ThiS [Deltaproteobacteria bacterium]|jgi:thiamine biosynthesis protein ThiS|nr:sulfur carrier protein ThiS [Deltaproteobacteria bacterium]